MEAPPDGLLDHVVADHAAADDQDRAGHGATSSAAGDGFRFQARSRVLTAMAMAPATVAKTANPAAKPPVSDARAPKPNGRRKPPNAAGGADQTGHGPDPLGHPAADELEDSAVAHAQEAQHGDEQHDRRCQRRRRRQAQGGGAGHRQHEGQDPGAAEPVT